MLLHLSLAQVLPLVSIAMSSTLSESFTAFILASKPERDKSIVDLTGEGNDDNVELRRAIQASLSTSAYPPSSQFRPSDRAPDPNWAMVPSNVCTILLV